MLRLRREKQRPACPALMCCWSMILRMLKHILIVFVWQISRAGEEDSELNYKRQWKDIQRKQQTPRQNIDSCSVTCSWMTRYRNNYKADVMPPRLSADGMNDSSIIHFRIRCLTWDFAWRFEAEQNHVQFYVSADIAQAVWSSESTSPSEDPTEIVDLFYLAAFHRTEHPECSPSQDFTGIDGNSHGQWAPGLSANQFCERKLLENPQMQFSPQNIYGRIFPD